MTPVVPRWSHVAASRSEWNPETLREQPSDGDAFRAWFERANERFQRG